MLPGLPGSGKSTPAARARVAEAEPGAAPDPTGT